MTTADTITLRGIVGDADSITTLGLVLNFIITQAAAMLEGSRSSPGANFIPQERIPMPARFYAPAAKYRQGLPRVHFPAYDKFEAARVRFTPKKRG